jgi:cell division septation protein DedD
MNKNTGRGLSVLVVMIIVAVGLWWLYLAGPPRTGFGPVATSPPAPAPAVIPPPATPEPKKSAQPESPVPPIKTEPPQGIAPLQEPSPPAATITLPPPLEMKEHYGILVDSYLKYGDAAKMLEKLKKQGKPAFVQRDPKDPNRFQVWLGPFSSQDEARAAQKDMSAKLKKPLKIEQIENPVPK